MMKAIVVNLTAGRLVSSVFFMLFVFAPFVGHAQGMHMDIPFQFIVGSKPMPAGGYTFSVDQLGLVLQSDTSGKSRAMILTRLTGPSTLLQEGAVVFDKSGPHPILSEVWIPGSRGILVYSIPKGHLRDAVLLSTLNETRSVPGKTAFKLTCAHCHGENGNGNPAADKFFNTEIPRLTSSLVQGKSDAELKEIVNKGTQTMPPVEVEDTGFKHRLPPQDVEAVIAYVRTLKQ